MARWELKELVKDKYKFHSINKIVIFDYIDAGYFHPEATNNAVGLIPVPIIHHPITNIMGVLN